MPCPVFRHTSNRARGPRRTCPATRYLRGLVRVLPGQWRPGALLLPLLLVLNVAGAASLATAAPAQDDAPTDRPAVECVVLLHGLGRTSRSMQPMVEALQAAAYIAVNLDYPSREFSIETLADHFVSLGIDRCVALGATRIHFVTHSMGGILVRYYLADHAPAALGRVVMLSPPNRGSEVADMLRDEPLYRWLNGPAGQQLGTGPDSLPVGLGPVAFPLGIMTGDRAAFYDGWLSDRIPGPDDGKVSVGRAQVAGMSDFLIVPYNHTTIMQEPPVIAQTLHFLRHGHFRRSPDTGDTAIEDTPDQACAAPFGAAT